ncbi:MAG TPA: recombinase family protein [Bacilli bacterium]
MKSTKRRVGAFYRVSTKGQLDGDDIPMQRRACNEFIEKQGWVLVKEYIEKGISGFKVSASKRDEIQRAKVDAEQKQFDILLVFMYDRLGRRDDETPFVMKWFDRKGIELWSVKEGRQKFEDHSDDLINYIRFWQSSGESKKTSMRVNEKHSQMVEDGLFRGGTAAYGYHLVDSGVKNKKGKELLKLKIHEEQAEIVRMMFNCVYEFGYGSNRITKLLNQNKVPTGTGGTWTIGVVNYSLRNPIYKGYMAYAKRKNDDGIFSVQSKDKWILSREVIQELAIIDEEIWEKVQEIRSSRNPDKMKKEGVHRYNISKSPLIFVGLVRCGHCGSPLTTTYCNKDYKLKDGTRKKKVSVKYRCSGKAVGKACDGQTLYAQNKVEGLVLEEVFKYLDQLKQIDFSKQIDDLTKKAAEGDMKLLKKLKNEIQIKSNELTVLNAEVPKSLLGKSSFKPELLGQLIDQKENELNEQHSTVITLENSLQEKKVEMSHLEELKKHIPLWSEIFKTAPVEKQKMMLHSIIEKILVNRDRIEVKLRLSLDQFIGYSIHDFRNDPKGRQKNESLSVKHLEHIARIIV